MRRAGRGHTAGCPGSGDLAGAVGGANRLTAVVSVLLQPTVTVLLLQLRVTRRARGTAGRLAFLRVGIARPGASLAPVALSQVFYSQSLDVLAAGDARARGLDLGKTLVPQPFWQNLGTMSGSLLAGVLFDEALRRAMPSLAWSIPATCSLAMLVAWTMGMRRARA